MRVTSRFDAASNSEILASGYFGWVQRSLSRDSARVGNATPVLVPLDSAKPAGCPGVGVPVLDAADDYPIESCCDRGNHPPLAQVQLCRGENRIQLVSV